jgi:Flp pilus assembly protein TadG
MLNWRRHERFLATDRRSVAALEFVLVAPILVILLFGVYDISTGMIFYEETYNTAHSIAASVSSLAVNQETGATALTFNQVQQAASEIWGGIPSLRADTQDGIKSVTISSVVFEKTSTSASCGTNGATPCYSPVVVWSEIYAGGDSHRAFLQPGQPGSAGAGTAASSTDFVINPLYYTPVATGTGEPGTLATQSSATSSTPIVQAYAPLRSCTSASISASSTSPGGASVPSSLTQTPTLVGQLNQTLPNAGNSSDLTNLRTLNLTDIPPSTTNPVAGPSPIIVVDVHLQYQPVIGFFVQTPIDFWVNAYWPVRSVQTTVTGTTTALSLYQQFTTLSATSINGGSNYSYGNDPAASIYQFYCLNLTLQGSSSQ